MHRGGFLFVFFPVNTTPDTDEEGGSDLSRSVQNAADELDQMFLCLDWTSGHEVLLVGRVEDDDGGHRHLSEKREQLGEIAHRS